MFIFYNTFTKKTVKRYYNLFLTYLWTRHIFISDFRECLLWCLLANFGLEGCYLVMFIQSLPYCKLIFFMFSVNKVRWIWNMKLHECLYFNCWKNLIQRVVLCSDFVFWSFALYLIRSSFIWPVPMSVDWICEQAQIA